MKEALIHLPLEAARKVGQAILWATEVAVPPKPSVETRVASITIFSNGKEQPSLDDDRVSFEVRG